MPGRFDVNVATRLHTEGRTFGELCIYILFVGLAVSLWLLFVHKSSNVNFICTTKVFCRLHLSYPNDFPSFQ